MTAPLRTVGTLVIVTGLCGALATDAAEPTASRREFEELHELVPGSLDRMFAEFRPRVAAEDPDLGRLWSLAAPAVVPASR